MMRRVGGRAVSSFMFQIRLNCGDQNRSSLSLPSCASKNSLQHAPPSTFIWISVLSFLFSLLSSYGEGGKKPPWPFLQSAAPPPHPCSSFAHQVQGEHLKQNRAHSSTCRVPPHPCLPHTDFNFDGPCTSNT